MPLGEVNVAPMRGGKSDLVILLANKHHLAGGGRTVFIKPSRDTRDPLGTVRSRSGIELLFPPTIVSTAEEVYEAAREATFCGIDEGHMFPPSLAAVLYRLRVEHGVHIVYGGLDTTWKNRAFATTAAVAILPGFKVYKHKAYCEPCASRTPTAMLNQKLRDSTPINILDSTEPTFEVGDAQYRPLCTEHWFQLTPGSYEALERGLIGIPDRETYWGESPK